MPEDVPCSESGVCQCVTIDDLNKTNKKLDKVAAEVRKIKDGHECVQRDRLIQLENREDENTKDIRKDIQTLALDVRSLIERLEKKKEQNGQTQQEIEHIHQEESEIARDVVVIKEKLADHEKIIEALSNLDIRMTKQEEKHQNLLDLIKGKDEDRKEKESVWQSRRTYILALVLGLWTIGSGVWIIIKDVLHW